MLLSISLFAACSGNSTANLPTPPPPAQAAESGAANAGQAENAPQSAAVPAPAVSTFQGVISRDVPPLPYPSPAEALSDWTSGDYATSLPPDYSGQDMSQFALTAASIQYACFDSNTKWPATLPQNFNPDGLLQTGKDPGLGVSGLHSQGITGKGVGIAMIGVPIPTGHVEYKDSLVDYEEIHTWDNFTALTQSCADAVSLMLGATCGVAPDAKLYYFVAMPAETQADMLNPNPGDSSWQPKYDLSYLTQALNRILAINSQLADADKIRALYSQFDFEGGNYAADPGYVDMMTALEKLRVSGVFDLNDLNNGSDGDGPTMLYPLSRNPLEDPDDSSQYGPSGGMQNWLSGMSFRDAISKQQQDTQNIAVPSDDLTAASVYANDAYRYQSVSNGGALVRAYIGGLYALACQADPQITEDIFIQAAKDTASKTDFVYGQPSAFNAKSASATPNPDAKTTNFNIVNPAALLAQIGK